MMHGTIVYLPTFTLKINQMQAKIPYMDPMENIEKITQKSLNGIANQSHCSSRTLSNLVLAARAFCLKITWCQLICSI